MTVPDAVPSAEAVRILIVDDHPVVRRGIARLLGDQPGWRVVGEAADLAEAVRIAQAADPSVAIVDFALPGDNGAAVTRALLAIAPQLPVLVYSMHDGSVLLREAIAAGARGFVSKGDAENLLVAGVSALLRGEAFLTGRASKQFLTEGGGGVQPTLTTREREVVALIARGLTSRDAGTQLGISARTVETHRAAAMRKLGTRSTADLVRYAIREFLVD